MNGQLKTPLHDNTFNFSGGMLFMNTTEPRFRLLLFIICIVLLFVSSLVLYVVFAIKDWIIALLVSLGALFVSEIWRQYTGKKNLWLCLNTKDKLLYSASSVTILVGLLIPMKEKIPSLLGICFVISGIGLAWFFTHLFGSKNLMRMFWGRFYKHSLS
jgi:hypothetical protein